MFHLKKGQTFSVQDDQQNFPPNLSQSWSSYENSEDFNITNQESVDQSNSALSLNSNQTWPESFDDQAWSNFDRYENHQEILNQDRYDVVCEDVIDDTANGNEVPIEEPNEKRLKVMNELIATEKDYLENLHIVKEYFINPLKKGNMLIEDEMEIIFINWNDLVLCTNRLYKSLKIRRKMTTKKDINIGDILCENVSKKGSYDCGCNLDNHHVMVISIKLLLF